MLVFTGRVGGFFIITIIIILSFYQLFINWLLTGFSAGFCLFVWHFLFYRVFFFFFLPVFSSGSGELAGIDEHANIDSIGSVAELEDLAAAADCVLVSLDGCRFGKLILMAACVHVVFVRVGVCSVIAHYLPVQSIIAMPPNPDTPCGAVMLLLYDNIHAVGMVERKTA